MRSPPRSRLRAEGGGVCIRREGRRSDDAIVVCPAAERQRSLNPRFSHSGWHGNRGKPTVRPTTRWELTADVRSQICRTKRIGVNLLPLDQRGRGDRDRCADRFGQQRDEDATAESDSPQVGLLEGPSGARIRASCTEGQDGTPGQRPENRTSGGRPCAPSTAPASHRMARRVCGCAVESLSIPGRAVAAERSQRLTPAGPPLDRLHQPAPPRTACQLASVLRGVRSGLGRSCSNLKKPRCERTVPPATAACGEGFRDACDHVANRREFGHTHHSLSAPATPSGVCNVPNKFQGGLGSLAIRDGSYAEPAVRCLWPAGSDFHVRSRSHPPPAGLFGSSEGQSGTRPNPGRHGAD